MLKATVFQLTSWHHEKCATLSSVSKTLNDQRSKVGQATIGNGNEDVEEEHQPSLGVKETFPHLE